MSWDILPKANLQYFLQKLKEKFDLKVDKVSGKGLSTNDYTTSEKNKLSAAYTHANDSNKLTTATASGFYKVASTNQGHIASLTAVKKSDITGLGIPAQDTTYTFATGDTNGQIKVTPSDTGTAQNISVKGLKSAAYKNENALSISESQVTNLTTDLSQKAVNLELTNEDLNTVKETGFYIGKSGNTCTNKPSGVSQFGLIVIKTATSNSFSWKQICVKPSGAIYQRTDQKISDVETWSAWEEVKTTDTDTTYTFAEGSSNGTFSVTPSGGSPQSVAIHGLGDRAYDSTNYLPSAGGTLTGTLSIRREYSEGGSEAFSRINLRTGYTPTGGSKLTNDSYIDAHSPLGGTGGNNLVINPKGNLFIGGGEAPNSHYALYAGTTGEITYITGDNIVHIQAAGNTIANRKGLQISNSHTIVPDVADTATDNVGSIGSSNYRWANGYFNNLDSNNLVFNNGNYKATLSSGTLTDSQTIALPNISGSVVVSSSNYGNSYKGTSGEYWYTVFQKFRDLYLTDYSSRRSVIRVSSMDGYTQLIFQCARWRNVNEQTWTCTFNDYYGATQQICTYTYTFISKAEEDIKLFKTLFFPAQTSTTTDLTFENANRATLYVN